MRLALVAIVLLVGLTAVGCGGKKKPSVFETAGKCPAPPSTTSAGNAQISTRASGGRYSKVIVIHATEKSSGAPVQDGKVTVYAQMSCPMFMRLVPRKLKETSPGTYKSGYQLIMPGQWAFYIILRDKNGDATTSAYPIRVKAPGT